MRVSMLALAGILACAAPAALGQVVIDVESQRAAEPPQDQPQPQPPQPQPALPPQSAPDESHVQAKDDSRLAPAGGGRFTFNRIDNGFLRLDNQSGQVAYCRTQAAGWACEAVPENRAEPESDVARLQADLTALNALKSEIARLQDEVASLKREIANLKEPPPPPRPPADLTPPNKGGDATIKLPTQQDIARARDFIEKTWQRLVDMITAVQKDMMQKG